MTPNLMVSSLDLSILSNEPLHLGFQKLLQKQVHKANVDPLLFLLQLLAHSFDHHLFHFFLPLVLPSQVLMLFVESVVEGV